MGTEPPQWLPPEASGSPHKAQGPPQPPIQPFPGSGQQQPQWPAPHAATPAAGFYPPAEVEPDNGPAVTGFVLALAGLGLLLYFAGFSAPLALVVGVFAVIYARRGRRKVESGETNKHAGLADAAFWLGIATVVLSLLAAAGWIAFFLTVDNLDFESLEEDPNDPDGVRSALSVAAVLARVVAGLS